MNLFPPKLEIEELNIYNIIKVQPVNNVTLQYNINEEEMYFCYYKCTSKHYQLDALSMIDSKYENICGPDFHSMFVETTNIIIGNLVTKLAEGQNTKWMLTAPIIPKLSYVRRILQQHFTNNNQIDPYSMNTEFGNFPFQISWFKYQ